MTEEILTGTRGEIDRQPDNSPGRLQRALAWHALEPSFSEVKGVVSPIPYTSALVFAAGRAPGYDDFPLNAGLYVICGIAIMSLAANTNRSFHSRRDVLRFSAGAAAAMLSPFPVFAQQTREPAEKAAGPTLGFSTYGMKSLSTERALKTLAEIGYDAVEIAVRSGWDADSAQLKPDRRRSLRGLLKEFPLKLSALMEHVQPVDDKQQAEALERLKLAAELAHDLAPSAPPLIQTVLGGGRFEDVKQPLLDRLAEWVKLADAAEIGIAIKPHRGGAVSQPAEAVWLFEQLGKPQRLRMVYDYSHYAFRDLPLDETIRTALPYTAHIAVKDPVQEGDKVVFKLPGEAGTVDFPRIIRQFTAAGYRGDFNCEVSGMVSSQPGYDPVDAAKTCYVNMSAAFKKAGVNRVGNS